LTVCYFLYPGFPALITGKYSRVPLGKGIPGNLINLGWIEGIPTFHSKDNFSCRAVLTPSDMVYYAINPANAKQEKMESLTRRFVSSDWI